MAGPFRGEPLALERYDPKGPSGAACASLLGQKNVYKKKKIYIFRKRRHQTVKSSSKPIFLELSSQSF